MWRILYSRKHRGLPCAPLEEKPDARPELNHIWKAFRQLNRTRKYSEYGHPYALSYTEIEAYCRLYGIAEPITFTELIETLDLEFISYQIKKQKESEQTKKSDAGKEVVKPKKSR